jgi:hypothetical protein
MEFSTTGNTYSKSKKNVLSYYIDWYGELAQAPEDDCEERHEIVVQILYWISVETNNTGNATTTTTSETSHNSHNCLPTTIRRMSTANYQVLLDSSNAFGFSSLHT